MEAAIRRKHVKTRLSRRGLPSVGERQAEIQTPAQHACSDPGVITRRAACRKMNTSSASRQARQEQRGPRAYAGGLAGDDRRDSRLSLSEQREITYVDPDAAAFSCVPTRAASAEGQGQPGLSPFAQTEQRLTLGQKAVSSSRI